MKYRVAKSKIHGDGVFATQPIKKGEYISDTPDYVDNVNQTIASSFHNHDEKNANVLNTEKGNQRFLIAKRGIEVGEELTADYNLTPSPPFEDPNNFKDLDERELSLSNPEELQALIDAGYELEEMQDGGGTKTYTVKSGDTFYGIANKLGVSWSDLKLANPNINYDKLDLGQVLNVPEQESVKKDTEKTVAKKVVKQKTDASSEGVYNDYFTNLKFQENSVNEGLKDGLYYPYIAVEDKGEDNPSYDIGFGNKLTKAEKIKYSKGITKAKAEELMKAAFKQKQKYAASYIDEEFGEGTFDKLDPASKVILTDYQYNVSGGIGKFPNFAKGVVDKDKDVMLKEYIRYSGSNPLGQRNTFTKDWINKYYEDTPKEQDGGPIVKQRRGSRKNPDGTVSSHLMRAEYIPEIGWVGFPSLFQDSKPYADDQQNWVDMSEEEDWMKVYEEAERRGEVYYFGEDKEAALAFGEGSWKDQLPEREPEEELYNMKRARELGYERDGSGHLPSVDEETGMFLKSMDHPTAWKEYMYGQLNKDIGTNTKVVVNPEGHFGDKQLQYVELTDEEAEQYREGGYVLEELEDGGEDDIIRPHGDSYEYKKVGDKYYTRKREGEWESEEQPGWDLASGSSEDAIKYKVFKEAKPIAKKESTERPTLIKNNPQYASVYDAVYGTDKTIPAPNPFPSQPRKLVFGEPGFKEQQKERNAGGYKVLEQGAKDFVDINKEMFVDPVVRTAKKIYNDPINFAGDIATTAGNIIAAPVTVGKELFDYGLGDGKFEWDNVIDTEAAETTLDLVSSLPVGNLIGKGVKVGTKIAKPLVKKAITKVDDVLMNAPRAQMTLNSGVNPNMMVNAYQDIRKGTSKVLNKNTRDWSSWNKATAADDALVKELNATEQALKKNDQWLKNSDGTVYTGSPEAQAAGLVEQEYIMVNSPNFKAVYPQGYNQMYSGRGSYNLLDDVATENPSGKSIFGTSDLNVAKTYTTNPKIVQSGEGVYNIVYPKTSSGNLNFNNRGRGYRQIGVDPKLNIQNTFNSQVSPIRLGSYVDDSGKYVQGQLVSTDDLARHLEVNKLNSAKIADIFDGAKASDVQILNLKPGNYPKTIFGNKGTFDLNNPALDLKKGGFILDLDDDGVERYRAEGYVLEKFEEGGEDDVVRPKGDPYEYKKVGDKYYTRKREGEYDQEYAEGEEPVWNLATGEEEAAIKYKVFKEQKPEPIVEEPIDYTYDHQNPKNFESRYWNDIKLDQSQDGLKPQYFSANLPLLNLDGTDPDAEYNAYVAAKPQYKRAPSWMDKNVFEPVSKLYDKFQKTDFGPPGDMVDFAIVEPAKMVANLAEDIIKDPNKVAGETMQMMVDGIMLLPRMAAEGIYTDFINPDAEWDWNNIGSATSLERGAQYATIAPWIPAVVGTGGKTVIRNTGKIVDDVVPVAAKADDVVPTAAVTTSTAAPKVVTPKQISSTKPSVQNQVRGQVQKVDGNVADKTTTLTYKSFDDNGKITNLAKDKTGKVNTEQALKILDNESSGTFKSTTVTEAVKKKYNGQIPKKIDPQELQTLADETIPVWSVEVRSGNKHGLGKQRPTPQYGIHRLDYDNRPIKFEAINDDYYGVTFADDPVAKSLREKSKEMGYLESEIRADLNYIQRAKTDLKDPLKSKMIVESERELSLAELSLAENQAKLKTMQGEYYKILDDQGRNYNLENNALVFKSDDLYKKGFANSEHTSLDNTVAHVHYVVRNNSPKTFTVTQFQSDAFQSGVDVTRKFKESGIKHAKNELQQYANYKNAKKLDVEWSSREYYQAKNAIDGNEIVRPKKWFDDQIANYERKRVFANTNNKEQTILDLYQAKVDDANIVLNNLDEYKIYNQNWESRTLQETVDYAAKNGQTNFRFPTGETNVKVQGYNKRVTEALNDKSKMKDFVGNDVRDYNISQRYEKTYPRLVEKTYGVKPKKVTDVEGNTWWQFDIPEKVMEGNKAIIAYKQGGSVEISLSPEDTQRYVDGGYILEEIN